MMYSSLIEERSVLQASSLTATALTTASISGLSSSLKCSSSSQFLGARLSVPPSCQHQGARAAISMAGAGKFSEGPQKSESKAHHLAVTWKTLLNSTESQQASGHLLPPKAAAERLPPFNRDLAKSIAREELMDHETDVSVDEILDVFVEAYELALSNGHDLSSATFMVAALYDLGLPMEIATGIALSLQDFILCGDEDAGTNFLSRGPLRLSKTTQEAVRLASITAAIFACSAMGNTSLIQGFSALAGFIQLEPTVLVDLHLQAASEARRVVNGND